MLALARRRLNVLWAMIRDHTCYELIPPTAPASAAWDNVGFGFTEAGTAGAPRLTADTAYRNAAAGFAFVHSAAVLGRDLALANHPDDWLGGQARHTGNSWDQQDWTTTALRLTGASRTTAPRAPDGSCPHTVLEQHPRQQGRRRGVPTGWCRRSLA